MLRKWGPLFILALSISLFAGCNRFGRPSDAAITTDIKAKMFSDPNLKSSNVDVSVKDGQVTISGQVPDDTARLAAFKIASEEKGVTKVNDQMTIQAAQAAPETQSTASEANTSPVPAPAPERSSPRRRTKSAAPPSDESSNPPTQPSESAPPAAEAPSAPAQAQAAPSPPPPPPPPQPRTVTVPANSIITVRTIDSIDSATNSSGQVFRASLDAPIVVGEHVIVPKGADAYITLANASSAGRIKGKSELTLQLTSIVFEGRTYDVVSGDVRQSGSSRGQQSAKRIGGGAAIGALIGAIAGGGKGAAIGAAVGGGAGTGVQVFTKGKQVKIPSETRLDFTLQQPLDITYFPARRSHHNSSASPRDQPPSQ